MPKILELENIEKSFGSARVLKGVNLTVSAGRTLALAGENGAGKSTLMKIITGIHRSDSGSMRLRGQKVNFRTARQSMNAGIAMIHQELNLLPELSVAENIFLGREPVTKTGRILWSEIDKLALHWLSELRQEINPKTKIKELSIAQQQMVEIARALSMDAEIIIMDEPTDSLTDVETQVLFDVVDRLTNAGKGLVFISHRLGEIFKMCDDVAVLRDGHMVYQGTVADITEDDLISHMVGRELSEQYPFVPAQTKQTRLSVHKLHAAGVRGVSFSAAAGEVVGFAGLVGAGRTEVAKAIYGANSVKSGHIEINGEVVSIKSPKDGLKNRIAYVTEDRKTDGLIQAQSVKVNMSLPSLRKFTNAFGKISQASEKIAVQRYVEKFAIKTHDIETPVTQLSGGNQQKVSIGKSLITAPQILILDEPTRGVDVGAKREIYTLINELKSQGLCILLMSSDMPELLGISDRILVMANGKLTGEFPRKDADQEAIMRCTVAEFSKDPI